MPDLLIGCGNSRIKKMTYDRAEWVDLVTLDHDPNCGADILHDLDATPWPLPASHFDTVHAYEVLEHIGQQGDYRAFFRHFTEIWRVLKPDGYLFATTPAWDDPWAWGDPSHTRLISGESLTFLSQKEYSDQVGKTPMTDFRWLYSADFDVIGGDITNGKFSFCLQAKK